jgi:small subunit ribosomal protein S1
MSLKGETLKVLEEGVILEGTVKNITDYGAFVDLGGIDGLLHITDMSWGRIGHPSEVLNVADKVRVVVLKYDPERERVSLGMKQILPDPWHTVHERFHPGMKVRGKVVSLTDYGAFIELEKGVEGLIHVSEMSWTRRVSHPSKVLNPGDEVDVVVLDVDPANRRISLGLKQAEPNPWEMVKINHPVGSHITGKVKSITDFGIFVGVDEGIDGLVHVSDLHWTKKLKHPSDLYKKGDDVEAVVLAIDVERERISLGIKQLDGDPFTNYVATHDKGNVVKGTVKSLDGKGAVIALDGDVEGYLRASEVARDRVEDIRTHLKEGDPVNAMIINIDRKNRSINLSIKAKDQAEETEAMQNVKADSAGTTSGTTNLGALLRAKMDNKTTE